MIKFRQNIIFQYTLTTFVVSLAVSLVLGFLLSQRLSDQAIKAYTNFFPRVVAYVVKDKSEARSLLASGKGAQTPLEFEGLAAELQSLGSVFDVKIWDRQGTIVWSSKKELVGKNFKDDPDFKLASGGAVSSAFMRLDKDENRLERYSETALEIFAPVRFNNETVGVVEFYESARELLVRIKQGVLIVWTSVAVAGVFFVFFLFFFFFYAPPNP